MITFITWLRCFAAMLITNAHYTGIYPTDLIANGGLIGDILFFSVSGYCLTNIKTSFWKWYGKRVSRILPAVILITIIYAVFGQYDLKHYASGTEKTLLHTLLSTVGIEYPKWLSWFIYPTCYHFVGSILVLYIPYYIIMKSDWIRKYIPAVMGIIFVMYVACYVFVYDKSYYHIDTVREPMIRFLFMESMLLGAWFKLDDEKLRNNGRAWVYSVGTVIAFGGYFVSKIFFSRGSLANFQVVNQVIIFILLYLVFRWFSCIDRHLEKAPEWLKQLVGLVAKLTLEIYLVQYVLIDVMENMKLFFPLNWLVLTALIVVSAFVLHTVVDLGLKQAAKLIMKGK